MKNSTKFIIVALILIISGITCLIGENIGLQKGTKQGLEIGFKKGFDRKNKGMIHRYSSWHQPIHKYEKEAMKYIFYNISDVHNDENREYEKVDTCYKVCKEEYESFLAFSKKYKDSI